MRACVLRTLAFAYVCVSLHTARRPTVQRSVFRRSMYESDTWGGARFCDQLESDDEADSDSGDSGEEEVDEDEAAEEDDADAEPRALLQWAVAKKRGCLILF